MSFKKFHLEPAFFRPLKAVSLRALFTLKILSHRNSYRWLERTQSSPKLVLPHWLRTMTHNLQCEKSSELSENLQKRKEKANLLEKIQTLESEISKIKSENGTLRAKLRLVRTFVQFWKAPQNRTFVTKLRTLARGPVYFEVARLHQRTWYFFNEFLGFGSEQKEQAGWSL